MDELSAVRSGVKKTQKNKEKVVDKAEHMR